jgi:predicted dehydrogenase
MNAQDLAELAGKADYTKLIKVEQLKVQDSVEPLRKQAEAFCRSVATGAPPVVSGSEGLAALRTAEAIVQSIQQHRWGEN